MPAIVGTTVISVITACYRLDVTPSYPDMTWQTQYSTIGAITDPHTALLPYQNSGRLQIGVRYNCAPRTHWTCNPASAWNNKPALLHSTNTIACNMNQFYNQPKRKCYTALGPPRVVFARIYLLNFAPISKQVYTILYDNKYSLMTSPLC